MDGIAVKPSHIAGINSLYGPADSAVKFLKVGEISVFFRKFYGRYGFQHVHSAVHAVQRLEENGLNGVPEIAENGLDFLSAENGLGVAGEQNIRMIGHNGAQGVEPCGDVPVLAAADSVQVGPAGVVVVAAAENPVVGEPDKELVVSFAYGGNQFQPDSVNDPFFLVGGKQCGGRKKIIDSVADGMAFPDADALSDAFFVGEAVAKLAGGAFVQYVAETVVVFEGRFPGRTHDDLLRRGAESAGAAPMVRVAVGVDNGFYLFMGQVLEKGLQPFSSFIRVETVDEDEGSFSFDGNGIAVAQARDAADPVSGLDDPVWKCSFCMVFQSFFTCHGVPPVI